MLRIGAINTTQTNTTAFKSKVSSEKMAAEKLAKLKENPNLKRNTNLLKCIETFCKPKQKNIQNANNYPIAQVNKVSSEKMVAEKLAKLIEVL